MVKGSVDSETDCCVVLCLPETCQTSLLSLGKDLGSTSSKQAAPHTGSHNHASPNDHATTYANKGSCTQAGGRGCP